MSQHTPGPWVAEKIKERQIRQWSIRAPGVAPVISYELASLSGRDPVRDRANAQLIAAAPALLEALQALLAEESYDDIPLQIWELAEDAIAKATGGSK